MPWRRVLSAWIFILLGAGTTGVGMGLVLLQARMERDALKAQIQGVQAQMTTLQSEHTRLMNEASTRITKIEAEKAEGQARLSHLLEAEQLFAHASLLPSPDPRTRRTWIETISVPLGLSLRTPTTLPLVTTDQAITATINGTAETAGDLWLSLTRYTPEAERSLLNQLTTTSTVQYRLGTRLLTGVRGIFQTDRTVAFLFRIEQQGQPQILLWVRAIPPLNETRLLEMLSTLTFAS